MLQYRKLLGRYGFPDLPPVGDPPAILRTVQRDIDDLGCRGLTTMPQIGRVVKACIPGCVSCGLCFEKCPENALFIVAEAGPPMFGLDQSSCSGVACRRCERVCPEAVFELNLFFRT